MIVRKGRRLGSVLVEEASTEPEPKKRAAAKKSTAAKKATPAKKTAEPSKPDAPVGEVGSTGESTGPHLSVKKESGDGD